MKEIQAKQATAPRRPLYSAAALQTQQPEFVPRKSQRRSATNPAPRRSLDEVGPYSRRKSPKTQRISPTSEFRPRIDYKSIGKHEKRQRGTENKKIKAKKESLIGDGGDSAIIFIRQRSFFHFLCNSVMTSVLISFCFNFSMN